MTVVSLLLVATLFAAWKAPAWVKEAGLLALVAGVLWALAGLFQMCGVLAADGGIPRGVVAGGLRCALIPAMYGLGVYGLSLVLRVVLKPRI